MADLPDMLHACKIVTRVFPVFVLVVVVLFLFFHSILVVVQVDPTPTPTTSTTLRYPRTIDKQMFVGRLE